MTDATITIETEAELVLAHLHLPPSGAKAEGLACPGTTKLSDLEDGLYSISLSATAQKPDTEIGMTFKTGKNQKIRKRWITERGTIGDIIDFFLKDGVVS